ncbi:hypothetical protein [Pantoea vagans]|uniref:hypothetical protein n=1 Tax=Pantoea vagans TaxID=470934 RepID=UPI0018683427|nr:hypothetical protein [Pantoea vagans]
MKTEIDESLFVPSGIMLEVRLIPAEVMREHRETAARASRRPISRITAGIFIVIWVICAVLLVRAFI